MYNHSMYTQNHNKKFLFAVYKNEWKEDKFQWQKNQEKQLLQRQKEKIDVNNILVSKKESYGNKSSFKYFIGYNDNDNIRPFA